MSALQDKRNRMSQSELSRSLLHLAVEILIRLNAVLKSARIYEPNNILFRRQVSLLLSLINQALTDFGEARLGVRQSTLFSTIPVLNTGWLITIFSSSSSKSLKRKKSAASVSNQG